MAPLIKAIRIQEKVKGVGFDWENPEQVWNKVEEEISEMQYEIQQGNDISKVEGEFGDLLFALVNYARFININPDEALEKTNRKFIKRFNYLEKTAKSDGHSLGDMTLEQMDKYWEEAKQKKEAQ